MNSPAANSTIPAATLAAIAWTRKRDGPLLTSAAGIADIADIAGNSSVPAAAPAAVFAAVPPDAGADTRDTTDRAGIFSIFADFRAATCCSNSR
jgi:hypothetical protein